jgi:hypothetical protein
MIGAEGAKAVAEAIKVNSTLMRIGIQNNGIGDDGAKAVAEAIKVNSMLEIIGLDYNNIGKDLLSQITEAPKEIRLTKKMNYCKLICAFTEFQLDSVRLRFDKMMLRFVN